jgi:hypothetical protein
MTQAPTERDIEAVLQHLKSFFAEPKDVVVHRTLSREVKLKILREWELDARRLSASEGEGFWGGEESMLERVEDAIALVQKQS